MVQPPGSISLPVIRRVLSLSPRSFLQESAHPVPHLSQTISFRRGSSFSNKWFFYNDRAFKIRTIFHHKIRSIFGLWVFISMIHYIHYPLSAYSFFISPSGHFSPREKNSLRSKPPPISQPGTFIKPPSKGLMVGTLGSSRMKTSWCKCWPSPDSFCRGGWGLWVGESEVMNLHK